MPDTGIVIKATGQVAPKGWTVCRMHGARGGAPRGEAHGNYWHGGRTRDVEEVRKLANLLARLSNVVPD